MSDKPTEEPKEPIRADYDISAQAREAHDREMEKWRKEQAKKRNINNYIQLVKPPKSKVTCINPDAILEGAVTYVCSFGEVSFCPCGGKIILQTYQPWNQEKEIQVSRCEDCLKTYSETEVRMLRRIAKPRCPFCEKPLSQQEDHREYFECMTQGCPDRGHVYHQIEAEGMEKTIIEYSPAWASMDEQGNIQVLADEWLVTIESWKCPMYSGSHKQAGHQDCRAYCGYRQET